MKKNPYSNFKSLNEIMSPDTPDGWLYIGDKHTRYVLGEPLDYNILVVGVNPSTAKPLEPDPTIRKVKHICNSYPLYKCGWIMVNLYPLRATDPNDLPNKADQVLSDNNVRIISKVLEECKIDRIWAAWGNLIESREYLPVELSKICTVQETLKNADRTEWYAWGSLTKRGNPRHPLYVKYDCDFEYLPVSDYLCEFPSVVPDTGLL